MSSRVDNQTLDPQNEVALWGHEQRCDPGPFLENRLDAFLVEIVVDVLRARGVFGLGNTLEK